MSDAPERKTILLVDDAPANIQVANSILKDTYKVRIATNGEKALELARTKPLPDLVLLDIEMPGMDGYEVCTRLKADRETRDIPVIFLTGKTEAEDETHGFSVGAVDYVHKPFSPAVVLARVQTHLALRGAREQLADQLLAIRKELELARTIQMSILPREVPKVDGLDIAVRYIPMTSVAGDFYDFIPVDAKRFGALVADVSGHGVPAALVASMLKIALGAQAPHAADPAKVLTGLNAALCGKFDTHFVTAAYLWVDMEAGTVDYAGAGHPPLLFGGGRGTRTVQKNGLFLGMFPQAKYAAVRELLGPGERILAYTDGIPEAKNPAAEEFGSGRLLELLGALPAAPADAFADRVLADVTGWAGRPEAEGHDDDITLLVIRRNDG
ncbi:MAG TPA: SpoIIE family protein phosphatase [Thermoanaerobaculia bacterium]|nr:SpoIIE family protein phosphatase [Thermoanaerobaculia bacterium]HQR68751.1 SpoIIE family protein phosphatase [Thermoanaerobaculia bacterium]